MLKNNTAPTPIDISIDTEEDWIVEELDESDDI